MYSHQHFVRSRLWSLGIAERQCEDVEIVAFFEVIRLHEFVPVAFVSMDFGDAVLCQNAIMQIAIWTNND